MKKHQIISMNHIPTKAQASRPTTHPAKGKSHTKLYHKNKTYNSRYSLVVTHPTTNLPI
jgi:hypothetical protein